MEELSTRQKTLLRVGLLVAILITLSHAFPLHAQPASPVPLSARRNALPDMSWQLPGKATTFTICGQVTRTDGKRVEGATVTLQQLGPEEKLARWTQLWTPVELAED